MQYTFFSVRNYRTAQISKLIKGNMVRYLMKYKMHKIFEE